MEIIKYIETKKSLSENSNTASFYLTARECDATQNRNEPDFTWDSGWSVIEYMDEPSPLPQDIVVCHGLSQLKSLLEEIEDNVRLYPGLPVPSEFFDLQSEVRPWENLVERFWYELLGQPNESDFVAPEQRCLIYFEVYAHSPEEAWKKLCTIDPSLSEVGYLQTTYPISYAEHDQPDYKYRFYCIAKDGSDLRGYKTAFMVKSLILYPFKWEVESDGYSYIKQWINPQGMSADCPIYGQDYLAAFGGTEANLKSGKLLDTHALPQPTEQEWSQLKKIADEEIQKRGV
jgi:hypothetical protein